MPASRMTLHRGTVGLVLGFAILALAGAIALHAETSRRSTGASVRQTLGVQRELNRLFALVEGAESGQRGFVITGDEKYLAPYDEASRSLEGLFDDLARSIADNPSQTKAFSQLRSLVQERMAIVRSVIDDMRGDRPKDAADLEKAGRGRTLMEQIRADISDMVEEEERLLAEREMMLASATSAFGMSIAVVIAVMIALAIFAVGLVQRQSDELRTADDQLVEETTRREELEAQLRQSQKLEAIGQLTGGIAHDFNNMLSVIVASLNILKRRLARGEGAYEQFINSAMDGAERAAKLIHRLLAFSRQQPLAPAPIDVNEFVTGMSNLLRRTLGEHVRLGTALADGLWLTEVDPNELESAIINLAVNARDAMPSGGRLTIETANAHLDDAYAAANLDAKPGQYVLVAVGDTGSGMSREVAARAFDPFFTTKAVGKGTGLGLSQVYGFVKQSGGHIRIYTELGRGTTIKIYLPRHVGPIDSASEADEEADKVPLGRADEVILVVEDDEHARRAATETVRELGYSVLHADGAGAALKILADRPDVALLMTDVVMPEVDGATLAKEARRRRPGLKVLFMSGYMRDVVVATGIVNPRAQMLSKPFTLEQAARKIREILDAP